VRTNNYCEGCHARLNRKAATAQLPLSRMNFSEYTQAITTACCLIDSSELRLGLVRECFKGESMEKAKIRPLATPKTPSQKLAGVLDGMQNFVAIGSGVSVPQTRDFAEHLG